MQEQIAQSLGGRLLTLGEARTFIKGQALYPDKNFWCAVKNPEGNEGRDLVQVGDF